jgi:hypothetical protein
MIPGRKLQQTLQLCHLSLLFVLETFFLRNLESDELVTVGPPVI